MSPQIFAGASQLTGLGQIWLLAQNDSLGAASDGYFLMTVWGQLPLLVILQGVIYPLWLRDSPMKRRKLPFVTLAVAVLCLFGALFAAVLLSSAGNSSLLTWVHACVLGIAYAVAVPGWLMALWLAAEGDSNWLSAVTLPASSLGCVALLFSPSAPEIKVSVVAATTLAGSVIFTILVLARNWPQQTCHDGDAPTHEEQHGAERVLTRKPATEIVRPADALWFFTRSLCGYGSGVAIQSQAIVLGPPAVSILGIVSKLVSGFSTVITNTLLPRLVNRQTFDESAPSAYMKSVMAIVGVPAVAALIAYYTSNDPWLGAIVLACAWIIAAAISSTSQRMATRNRAAALSGISIFVSIAVPAALYFAEPESVVGFIVTYCTLDLLVGVATLLAIRRIWLAAVAGALVTGLNVMVIISPTGVFS